MDGGFRAIVAEDGSPRFGRLGGETNAPNALPCEWGKVVQEER